MATEAVQVPQQSDEDGGGLEKGFCGEEVPPAMCEMDAPRLATSRIVEMDHDGPAGR